MSRVDTTIRATAGVTVVGLAGIAGAISYSHMAHLAHLHGESGWRGHMFPLSVDGIEIVASLVLLADKRAGRASGWLPWAALVAGTGASFAANMAVGGSDWIGRAVSGWPAFALLVAVKLLFGLLDHPATTDGADRGAADVTGTENLSGTVLRSEGHQVAGVEAVPGRDGTVLDGVGDGASDGVREPAVAATTMSDHSTVSTVLPVSSLMPAARAAGSVLAESGTPLTREALARQLRADGHAASNARISVLLKALITERSEASTSDNERSA